MLDPNEAFFMLTVLTKWIWALLIAALRTRNTALFPKLQRIHTPSAKETCLPKDDSNPPGQHFEIEYSLLAVRFPFPRFHIQGSRPINAD